MLAVPAAITWLGLAHDSNTVALVTAQRHVAEAIIDHASVNAKPCTMIWMERIGNPAAPPPETALASQDEGVAQVV
jgi:hypothetical protein